MKRNVLYPGTFDPITYGHIDLIKKALKIVDTVIVAISENSNKNYLFNSNERLEIVENALYKDLKLKSIPTIIECFDISNISGTNSVGSMVVAKNGLPAKNKYRKFIRSCETK